MLTALTRRQWMSAATGFLAGFSVTGSKSAFAQGINFVPNTAVSPIDLPQLRYSGRWNERPGAMRELSLELRLRTRIESVREPTVLSLDDDALFHTPFLYVSGIGSLPKFDVQQQARLRGFIDLGGLLILDDADGGSDHRFRNSVQHLVSRLLPGSKMTLVPADHVLFRSFYIVDSPQGRTRTFEHVLGVQDEGRLKVLFLLNDLGGALASLSPGAHSFPCVPGGSLQREWAIRFAVNIVLYATCLDYKSDPAHVETLLRRRQWK